MFPRAFIIMESLAANLLRKARIEVSPEAFNLVSVSHKLWDEILSHPELSPRMTAPFGLLRDRHEVTLFLDDTDFATIRNAIKEAKIERGFRVLTFDIKLDFSVVGFVAEVTKILAEAEIPIVVFSAFSRDHILVKQANLGPALKALSPFVSELC